MGTVERSEPLEQSRLFEIGVRPPKPIQEPGLAACSPVVAVGRREMQQPGYGVLHIADTPFTVVRVLIQHGSQDWKPGTGIGLAHDA